MHTSIQISAWHLNPVEISIFEGINNYSEIINQ